MSLAALRVFETVWCVLCSLLRCQAALESALARAAGAEAAAAHATQDARALRKQLEEASAQLEEARAQLECTRSIMEAHAAEAEQVYSDIHPHTAKHFNNQR
jgi:chromosome segregation ATPase